MPAAAIGLRLHCRFFIALTMLALLPFTSIHGQDWGSKMFDVKEIDFGVVPKGAEAAFFLNVKNLYKEEIQVTELWQGSKTFVWDSGIPITVRSGQQQTLTLRANTVLYIGDRKSKVRATVHEATRGASNNVEFPTKIMIRDDVAVTSGGASFGVVEQGTAAERKLVLQATGNNNWQISKVSIKNPDVAVVATETGRDNGTVTYELVVSLNPTASLGPIHDHITITTNEAVNTKLSIAVEGQVEPPKTERKID